MDLWMTQMGKLLTWMLGSPANEIQLLIAAVLGTLIFLLILTKIGDMLGAGISSTGRSSAMLAITLAAWLALTTATLIYAAHKIPANMIRWVPQASAVLVLLVISAPLTRVFQKTKYAKGLLLMVLSIAGSIAVVLLANSIFDAARHGGVEGDRIKERTREFNDFLSK
jgi:hypothetical protein